MLVTTKASFSGSFKLGVRAVTDDKLLGIK